MTNPNISQAYTLQRVAIERIADPSEAIERLDELRDPNGVLGAFITKIWHGEVPIARSLRWYSSLYYLNRSLNRTTNGDYSKIVLAATGMTPGRVIRGDRARHGLGLHIDRPLQAKDLPPHAPTQLGVHFTTQTEEKGLLEVARVVIDGREAVEALGDLAFRNQVVRSLEERFTQYSSYASFGQGDVVLFPQNPYVNAEGQVVNPLIHRFSSDDPNRVYVHPF